MSSSELDITLANLWEAIKCAMANIVQPLQVAQTTLGLTKVEAVQLDCPQFGLVHQSAAGSGAGAHQVHPVHYRKKHIYKKDL